MKAHAAGSLTEKVKKKN